MQCFTIRVHELIRVDIMMHINVCKKKIFLSLNSWTSDLSACNFFFYNMWRPLWSVKARSGWTACTYRKSALVQTSIKLVCGLYLADLAAGLLFSVNCQPTTTAITNFSIANNDNKMVVKMLCDLIRKYVHATPILTMRRLFSFWSGLAKS